MFAARREVGIQLMAELCPRVLDGFIMPVECALGVMVRFFMGRAISGIAVATEL